MNIPECECSSRVKGEETGPSKKKINDDLGLNALRPVTE